jgi:hypothetical protein
MRKNLLLFLLLIASVFVNRTVTGQIFGCLYPNDPITHPDYCTIAEDPTGAYNCYAYARASIEGHHVDLSSGLPISGSWTWNQFYGVDIPLDPKYLITGGARWDLISYPIAGHVVLKLRGGQYASKWQFGGTLNMQLVSNIYNMGYINEVTDPPQHMVYIGNVSPTSFSLAPGGQITFYANPVGVQDLNYSWSFDTNFFTNLSANTSSSTITLKAKCPGNSSQNITVEVWYPGYRKNIFTIHGTISYQACPPPPVDPCQGTYKVGTGSGGIAYPINTVNMVSNSPIVATLNGGSGNIFSWTLTSGNPTSWYYYGTGNNILYVSLASGKFASYHLVSSYCNRSITFSRSSSSMATRALNTYADSINASLDTLFAPYDFYYESAKVEPIEANVNNGVYMNQTRKVLIVNDNIEGVRAYKIISIQGILKKTGKIHSGKSEIDIQDLSSGIYIITLGDCSYRFIKQ